MIRIVNKKGFTLIEVLVVTGLIGLLLSVISLNLNQVRADARNVWRIAQVSQYNKAIIAVYPEIEALNLPSGNFYCLGTYPAEGVFEENECGTNGIYTNNAAIDALLSKHLPTPMPGDDHQFNRGRRTPAYIRGFLFRPNAVGDVDYEILYFLEGRSAKCGPNTIQEVRNFVTCTYLGR